MEKLQCIYRHDKSTVYYYIWIPHLWWHNNAGAMVPSVTGITLNHSLVLQQSAVSVDRHYLTSSVVSILELCISCSTYT